MNRLLLIAFLILSFSAAQAQWTNLDSATNEWLRGVWFTDANRGVAVGYNGTILKTTNGGDTWNAINAETDANFFSVFFADENTGYITGEGLTVLKTQDGGSTWMDVSPADNGPVIHESYFVTPDIGYIAGEFGRVYKTLTGGLNWEPLSDDIGSPNGKVSLFFINENLGYIAGVGSGDAIVKTTDGGVNWSFVSPLNSTEFTSIFFTNENTGYVCSSLSSVGIIRTDNAAASWELINHNLDRGLYAMKFVNENVGYAVGGFSDKSIVIKTSNAGDSWVLQNTNSDQSLFDVYAVEEDLVYAVGMNGTILRLGTPPTSINDISNEEISIYPNPTNGFLQFEKELKEVNVYNAVGKLVHRQITATNRIDLSQQPSGIYFVEFPNFSTRKKVIKN